jgi:hypothetical protein
VIDYAEKALYRGSCQNPFRVKALHIFQRCSHGSEAISDHFLFIGSEGLEEVSLSTGHADKGPTKRRGVSQGGISPNSPKWRHIVKGIAKQRHLSAWPTV